MEFCVPYWSTRDYLKEAMTGELRTHYTVIRIRLSYRLITMLL